MNVVRAELSCGHCESWSDMTVEVLDMSQRLVSSASLNSGGSFQLPGVREGSYQVVVRSSDGTTLHRDYVTVNGHSGPLLIRLPDQPHGARPAAGTVSLRRLQHKPAKPARKEYEAAEKKLRSGDLNASLVHLQKAVSMDPEYLEAQNNLGSRYMMMGQTGQALRAFEKALELDPDSALVQANIAVAHFSLKNYEAAEAASRRALQLDPSNVKSVYTLGLVLYSQKRYTPEAMTLLGQVQERFSGARMALAIMQAHAGHPENARSTLKAYLHSGDKQYRQQAEAMLLTLR